MTTRAALIAAHDEGSIHAGGEWVACGPASIVVAHQLDRSGYTLCLLRAWGWPAITHLAAYRRCVRCTRKARP